MERLCQLIAAYKTRKTLDSRHFQTWRGKIRMLLVNGSHYLQINFSKNLSYRPSIRMHLLLPASILDKT
jgi:hypothetical protein